MCCRRPHRSGRPAPNSTTPTATVIPTVSTGQNDPMVATHELRWTILAAAGGGTNDSGSSHAAFASFNARSPQVPYVPTPDCRNPSCCAIGHRNFWRKNARAQSNYRYARIPPGAPPVHLAPPVHSLAIARRGRPCRLPREAQPMAPARHPLVWRWGPGVRPLPSAVYRCRP